MTRRLDSSDRTSALSGLAALLGLAMASAFATGCAAEDDQMEARYPQGVGRSAVEEAPQTSASLEAIPPRDPSDVGSSVAIGVDGQDDGYAESDPSALTTFKPALDNYGTWQDNGTYGTVWVPSRTVVGNDFAPYVSAGHWTYDDDEYVWVSDYDWGWAPFHYGRWVYIGGTGWSWIPGRRYAGAWVTWRTGYDGYGYVGWAPLPPTWYWRGGYAYGLYSVPPAPYVFCGSHDVFAPAVAQHVVTGPQVPVIAANTRPYVPAHPGVGGAGGAGGAGVNGGRVAANPGVSGPPPTRLGLAPGSVPRAPIGHVGMLRAQQAAHPPRGAGIDSSSAASASGFDRGRAPIAGGSRSIGSGSSPVYSGSPTRVPSHGFSSGTTGPQAGAPPTFSSTYPSSSTAGARVSPTYGGGSSFPSSSGPTFHSSPGYSAPSYGAPYSGGGGSHFSGGGGSSPSFHSAPFSGGGGAMHAPSAPRPSTHTGTFSAPSGRHR